MALKISNQKHGSLSIDDKLAVSPVRRHGRRTQLKPNTYYRSNYLHQILGVVGAKSCQIAGFAPVCMNPEHCVYVCDAGVLKMQLWEGGEPKPDASCVPADVVVPRAGDQQGHAGAPCRLRSRALVNRER